MSTEVTKENLATLYQALFTAMPELYYIFQKLQEENVELRTLNEALREKELESKKVFDKLQRINQIKTQFFGTLSHDLRSPLTLILAASKKMNYEAESSLNVGLIERSAFELLRHVNDLMDISKLETKRIELFYSQCDLVRIVRHTAALFESHARNKNIKYQVNSPAEIPAELDVQKIQRILVSLLNHAFRDTPVGGIIQCKVRADTKHAIIEIADSGKGVSLEMRDTLFNNYFHGRVFDHKKVSSLSLGLSIVKDFIELHGGSIRIETSNLGGALFVIDIPLIAPSTAKIEVKGSDPKTFPKELLPEMIGEQGVPPELENNAIATNNEDKLHLPKVLIIEESFDLNQYISTILQDEYQIISAANVAEGLGKALQHQPDLIIGDLTMPVEVRKHKDLDTTPIVILAANMDDETCLKLFAEGAQDYLLKPFSSLELRARVANLIELKKAGDELRKKNIELVTANNELDAFGYSVSHDLRNPLQSIIGFCTLLLDAYQFDDEVRGYLKTMQNAGKRMDEIINDLLVLSHSLHEEVNCKDVNFSEMVKRILSKFQEQEPDRQVNIKVADEIYALADIRLMEIVFENLLNNAWKYTSKNTNAMIEFGIVENQVNPTYFIRDNGVGFEQAKASKLFVPFSRLHHEKDFPGTGVGLATVKRIIEKHDGKIWVESQPDKGTVFYFQLIKPSE